MLAQVTYIQRFIMADSEDEFMPSCVAASAALWQCLRGSAGRASGRRRPAGNIKHIWYRRPTACGHRLDARRPAGATIFGTHITDARPMPYDVRPMQNRPAGRLSEFPALRGNLPY